MNKITTLRLRLRSPNSGVLTIIKNISSEFSTKEETIKIPKRIPRGPTDILQALSNTVQRDPTAAHYKYHDDPYLIPKSNITKRNFALSKESGRKAAQWVRAQHADLFQHRVADPPVQAFYPRTTYNEESEVDEDALKKTIEDALVSDAITIYNLLEKKGQSISESTKQSLLELLCFFNCEDTVPEDMIEERWFKQSFMRKDKQRKTWKDSGLAETVFQSLENKTPAAYCTLLQARAKFYQVDRAWDLYQEMQEKQIPLTTEAYNSLLRVVCFLREGSELRWQLTVELLTAMSKQGLKPNVGTLNAMLEAISNMVTQKQIKHYALRILAEMKTAGVEPSLGSYYFLLIIFCKERGPVSSILVDIMNAIEGQTFKIEDPRDTHFFVTAMDVCRNHLHDVELAHRVNKLLHTGNNYDLIGDSFKESIYYRNYIILMCNMEPLDVFLQYYNKIVPNIYIPEPVVMEEVIKAVDMNGAVEHFPRLWSDMIIFDQVERQNAVAAILNGMVTNAPKESSELNNKFAEIALDAWNRLEVEADAEKYRQFSWTGQMLGNIMTLSLRGGNLNIALAVFQKLESDENTVIGVPNVEALQLLLESCISQNRIEPAIKCIQYSADAGFPEAGNFAHILNSSVNLSDEQKRKLGNIVGEDVLHLQSVEHSVT